VQKFVAFPVLHLTGEHFTRAFKLKFERRKGGYSYEHENSSDKTGKGKDKGRGPSYGASEKRKLQELGRRLAVRRSVKEASFDKGTVPVTNHIDISQFLFLKYDCSPSNYASYDGILR
jgi:hypothetical protein